MLPPVDVKELTIVDYLQILYKRIWIMVTLVSIIVGFVAYKDLSATKIYETASTVLVTKETASVTGEKKLIRKQTDITNRETQVLLLRSNSLADRVIESLSLLQDPQFFEDKDPARKLLSMIEINSVEESNVIKITVRGQDPLLIAKIANSWIEEFILSDVERRSKTTRQGAAWLNKQTKEALENLQKSEKELNTFVKENRIITIPEVGKKAERSIAALRAQKVQVEKGLIEALKLYKEKHPKIFAIKNQLAAVEIKLEEEVDAMYDLQEKALEYKLLSRDVANYKARYEKFQQRMQDLDISRELLESNIQLVDEAQPPLKPIYPNPQKDISMAFIFALAFGVGICYFLEYLDSTLKTSDDVELYTKMPFLGYTPLVTKEFEAGVTNDLITHKSQFSQIAESFRSIRVSLLFVSPEDKPIKSITITSTIPKEGKSFASINLAIAFASAKEKTLLVDADMRKGRLAKVFDLEGANGFTSVLAGMNKWQDLVVETKIPNLYFLPHGTTAPNPTQLLNSEKLKTILNEMEGQYKRVILDTPPVLSVADAIILGKKTDGLVFIIKAASTPLDHILAAKKILENKVQIIGVILNGVDVKKDRYYYYHYSYSNPDASKNT